MVDVWVFVLVVDEIMVVVVVAFGYDGRILFRGMAVVVALKEI